MAIAFSTGTINQPDAGSVGLAMVEKIRDDVVAHPAWALVEEFTAASGLGRWYVFQCSAAISGLSSDFYVVIGRTLGSGELRFFICEGYNSTTHAATFFAPNGNVQSSAIALDSGGRYTVGTYTLAAALLPQTGLTPFGNNVWIPSGTSTKWWLTVADDGFSVAFNGASNGFIHIGAYTPLSSQANPMPLHCWSLYSFGQLTRNPSVAGTTSKGAALNVYGSSPSLGFVQTLSYNDKLQGDQRPVAEIGLLVVEDNPGERVLYGAVIGKMKRVRIGGTTPVGFAFGDAYALQGRLWVPYLPTDGRMWDTGVAI